jgi:hypothetical protein
MYLNRENLGFDVTQQTVSYVWKSGFDSVTNRNHGHPGVTQVTYQRYYTSVLYIHGDGATRKELYLTNVT